MIVSPLRYPGGKAKLFPFFADLIATNELYGAEYCEPYAGGAGLAIRLLTEGFVDKISLNDIDGSICAFWRSAIYRSAEFCELLEATPITIEEWHRQREIWRSTDRIDDLEFGFATYFLNRTNRSGIIDGAGPIGGYEQRSEWNLSARLVKAKQISNIKALSKFANQIEITCLDALDFTAGKMRSKGTFIYLDPPYYVKGQKLYKNFYHPEDHAQIARKLRSWSRGRWVVSYDDVSAIRDLYDGFTLLDYSLNYSAGRVSLGNEVLFLSNALSAPPQLRFPNSSRELSSPNRLVESRTESRDGK